MQNRPLNEELLRALAYYGAAGGTGGGGGGGVSAYNDLLGKPIITSEKYPSGITINGTKSIRDYGAPETLQDMFDLHQIQSVSLTTPSAIDLNNTTNNQRAYLQTDKVGLIQGTDEIYLSVGGFGFAGDTLYYLIDSVIPLISSDVVVDVANWSATTTIIGNVDYYTNELSFTKVYVEHPDIVICPIGNTTLPTTLEREAFTLVTSTGYFYANLNNNKITVYSQVKPTSSFKISVRGAK